MTIEREQSLPPNGDVEPNDDAATASAGVASLIALIGDADGSVDTYRWTIAPDEAAPPAARRAWPSPGESLTLQLLDATGVVIDPDRPDPGGGRPPVRPAAGPR